MLALTILGLAGCAMALVALALDWRAQLRFESWRDASLEAVANGEDIPDWRTSATYTTTNVATNGD